MSKAKRDMIIPFSLSQLEIESSCFIGEIKDSFVDLPLDYYDMRLAQIIFLKDHISERSNELERLFPHYYTGQVSDHVLMPFLNTLPPEVVKQFNERIAQILRQMGKRFHLAA